MDNDTLVRDLSATDRACSIYSQYPTESEIIDWAEITEAIALLEPTAIRNWVGALKERFSAHPQAKRDLWSRLSVDCKNSLNLARKGGVA